MAFREESLDPRIEEEAERDFKIRVVEEGEGEREREREREKYIHSICVGDIICILLTGSVEIQLRLFFPPFYLVCHFVIYI